MKTPILADISKEYGISQRTLKLKYRDCILREGRQVFIDREKFDKVFPIRSRKGKASKQPATLLGLLGKLDLQLKHVLSQIENSKKVAFRARKRVESATEPEVKERRLLIYLDKQKKLQVLEIKSEKIKVRRNEAFARAKDELSEYDSEGLLGSL